MSSDFKSAPRRVSSSKKRMRTEADRWGRVINEFGIEKQ